MEYVHGEGEIIESTTMKEKLKEKLLKKYSKEDRGAFVFCYLLLALPLLQFLIFWLYVNGNSIVLAFKDGTGAWTLDNFKVLFSSLAKKDTDPYGWFVGPILGRTVLLWFVVNVVCTPALVLSTYVLYKKIPGHYFFRVVFAVPVILGAIVWTSLMRALVDVNGPILAIAKGLGMELSAETQRGLLLNEKTAFFTIVIITVIPNLVGCNIVLTGAYTRIPPEIFESGKIDGVGFLREFITIAVPLVWPTLVVQFIGILSLIFTTDGNVFLYTMGAKETGTMGFYIYYMTYRIATTSSADGVNAFGYPAAVGLFLTLITLPVVLLGRRFLERAFEPVEY